MTVYSPRAIMQAIDAMPSPWRELVYEYGFQVVNHLISEGCTLGQAREELAEWRKFKQAETLSTDHFLKGKKNERHQRTVRSRPVSPDNRGHSHDSGADARGTGTVRTRRKGTKGAKGAKV